VSERTHLHERGEATELPLPANSAIVPSAQPFDGAIQRVWSVNLFSKWTRAWAFLSIWLGALAVLPMFEGASTFAYAILVLVCVVLAVLVAILSAPCTIRVGVDGLLVKLVFSRRIIRWREIESFPHLEVLPNGMTVPGLHLRWGGNRLLALPTYYIDASTEHHIRKLIEERLQRVRAAVEPESLATIRRASRPIATWVEALQAMKQAHFRAQHHVDTSALLHALEIGKLSRSDSVQSAVAIAILGTRSQREALERLADQFVDRPCAAAIRAAAQERFDDPAIDRMTRTTR
jgi:hypothetical protein